MKNIHEYSQYKNPQVRALVWSLLSPGLVTESGAYPACVSAQWCRQIYERLQPFLEQLDNDPTALNQWLENYKSWRLGIRFEAYWAFIFEQLIKQNELLSYADHLQIQSQYNSNSLSDSLSKISLSKNALSQTMGELDFVYEDKEKQLNHLEVAVKFYLLRQNGDGFERLIGPNGGDWYERKLEHLFKKQLPLSDSQEAKEKLADEFKLDADDIHCQHHGLIKGMIFFPVTGEGQLNEHETRCINADLLTGTWGTINNWYLSDPGEIGRWVVLNKLDWLVPQVYTLSHPELEDMLYTTKEMSYILKNHFRHTLRSVLIARLDYDEEKKLWLEQQRVMVVDKYWPVFKRSIDSLLEQSKNRPRDTKSDKNHNSTQR
jgi:hypothetical protein